MHIEQLSTLGIGAALAALAAGWSQVKNFATRIMGLLIITMEIDCNGSGMAGATLSFLYDGPLKSSPSAFMKIWGNYAFLPSQRKLTAIPYEQLGNKGRLYWRGWRPLWASNSGVVTLRFLRGTWNADALLLEISKHAARSIPNRQRFEVIRLAGTSAKKLLGGFAATKSGGEDVTPSPAGSNVAADTKGRLVGWTKEDLRLLKNTKQDPLSAMALAPEVLEVVDDVERWKKSQDWYFQHQIPWRRGVLLYGPPGTGKSSLVKAIAERLNMPVYVMDISTMDNDEFYENYRKALSSAPAVVLIEDIDAVFHGRENVVSEKGKGLTFDCLLNTISGVDNSNGVLLAITTNNIDFLDEAIGVPRQGMISSRPGRIDRAVRLGPLDEDGRHKLAARILAGCHPSWIDFLVNQGDGDTGAQFEERCSSVALRLYWSANPQEPAPANVLHLTPAPILEVG